MNALQVQAQTLLDLIRPKSQDAFERKVNGYHRIVSQLGGLTARWAYASNRMPTQSSAILKSWEGRPHMLTIQGPVGSGKSATAARFIAEREGLMIRAGQIDRWTFVGTDGDNPGFAEAKNARWLLIDDMGMERAGSRGEEHLTEVLCARADAGRPTIVTTMLSPEDAKARYPEQLFSRLSIGWRLAGGEDLRSLGVEPDTTAIRGALDLHRMISKLDSVARGYASETQAREIIAKGRARTRLSDEDFADRCRATETAHEEHLAAFTAMAASAGFKVTP
jgi:hypothetical protein